MLRKVELTFGRRKQQISFPTKAEEGLPIRTSDFLRKPRRGFRLPTSVFRPRFPTFDFRLGLRTSYESREGTSDLQFVTSDFRPRPSDSDFELPTKAEEGLPTSHSCLPTSTFDFRLGLQTSYESRKGTSDFRFRTPDFLRKPRRDLRLDLEFRLPNSVFRLLISDFRHRTSTSDNGLRTSY